jgi:hypothetical protein
MYFFLDITHIYNTVFIPAVIQGWARPRWVVNLLLLDCTGRGGGLGKNLTHDWTLTVTG